MGQCGSYRRSRAVPARSGLEHDDGPGWQCLWRHGARCQRCCLVVSSADEPRRSFGAVGAVHEGADEHALAHRVEQGAIGAPVVSRSLVLHRSWCAIGHGPLDAQAGVGMVHAQCVQHGVAGAVAGSRIGRGGTGSGSESPGSRSQRTRRSMLWRSPGSDRAPPHSRGSRCEVAHWSRSWARSWCLTIFPDGLRGTTPTTSSWGAL